MNPEHSTPRRLLSLLALGALAAPLPALAQSYTFSQSFGSYSTISGSGSPTSASGDDSGASITLPFSFPFFGSPVSSVYASTNGLLCFGSASTSYSTTAMPTPGDPDGMVAVFWDDMSIPSGSAIYTAVSGTSGRRIFTIEWYGLTPLSSSSAINVQVRLYEQTGNIDILYGSAIGSGGGAGVGIEDQFGSSAYGPSCGLAGTCTFSDVPSGTLFTFAPSSAPPMQADLIVAGTTSLPSSAQPGGTYTLDVTVQNIGGALAGSTEVQVIADVFGSPTTIGEGFVSSISAGQTGVASISYTVPSGVPNGSYPITVFVDPFNSVTEANESNNQFSAGSVVIGGGGSTITITSGSLPAGTVGASYSFQLQQSGGSSPFWSVISGSLPSGISLSSSGRLSGSPTVAGLARFTVECSQSGLTSGTRAFELEVTAATGFRISSTSLPQGTVGQGYSGRIEATGGQAPYAYQIVSGRPGWLTMAADGSLSGTPDTAGMHELHVSVFDSATQFTEGVVTLEVVQGGPLTMVTTQSDVVGGVVNLPYMVTVRASGGMQPYSFSISNGSLPGGLSLEGDVIRGTPSSGGSSNFELRVQDSAGGSATVQLSIMVTERTPLVIQVQDSITVRPDQESDLELRAMGGVPPYSWAVTGGALPAGLRIEDGHIRGTATSSRATAHVTLRVGDTQGESAEKALTIEVRKTNTIGSGGARRDAGGCECVTPAGDRAPLLALAALALAGLVVRRRRSFLRTVSMVEEEACPSRSSLDAPRSSRL